LPLIKFNNLLFSLAIAALILPMASELLLFTAEQAITVALFTLQISALYFINLARLATTSRSLQLFWQYLLFAILFATGNHLLSQFLAPENKGLANDFFTLLSYFFIFLAIETNPQQSDVPLNKYLNGRLPILFFAVFLFSYLVLLPTEYNKAVYQSRLPSILFQLILSSVILLRLSNSLARNFHTAWRGLFMFLVAAALVLLTQLLNSFHFLLANHWWLTGYSHSLLQLTPYLFLLLAARTVVQLKSPWPVSKQTSSPECYLIFLILIFLSLHLFGNQLELFYRVNNHLQAIIVGLWLLVSTVLLLNIVKQKQQNHRHLARQNNKLQVKLAQLTDETQQLYQSLLNSEEKAIVRAANSAILTCSTQGIVLSANPAAVQLFQSLEQELIGLKVDLLFPASDEMHFFFEFQSNVYALQRKTDGISVECTALRPDGSEFPAQAELQWAEREQQPLIVITFINLTARKRAEQQLLDLKDKFIANISHEFRTPLTIINGIIDRYLAASDNDSEQQALATAKRNGLRLVRMVEQLLELSRLNDNPTLTLSPYQLHNLMAMPVDSFQRLARQNDLSFSADIADGLWLECDGQAFEKIIFNLLANAIKYTPAGGSIAVNAYLDPEQESIIIDVIDSGIGISKSSQSQIFERFQRADDHENQAVFGVGIGLSLVNELIKAHGWRISLNSEKGRGSKFTIALPKSSKMEQEQSVPMSLSEHEVSSLLLEQRSVSANQSEHTHQVILVIEDNPDMQLHIKQVVEQQHHCILAGSGEQGLVLAQDYLPDLIVCDLMLTGIDGFEVLTQLKQSELTSHIPVILLTARSDLDSRLQGLSLHADEYLSKPFNQKELLTRIDNLIANRKTLQLSYLQQFKAQHQELRKQHSHDNAIELTEPSEKTPTLDEKFLLHLEQITAKHYADPELDIKKLASHMAMSERQFQRKLKMMFGTNPTNFIKEFRLKKAVELLTNGSQIGRIAMDVGFSSQTYFGRCFKETYGCTPKQYKQQLTEQAENAAAIQAQPNGQ
jgi:PAS domain S-box-containing protein